MSEKTIPRCVRSIRPPPGTRKYFVRTSYIQINYKEGRNMIISRILACYDHSTTDIL